MLKDLQEDIVKVKEMMYEHSGNTSEQKDNIKTNKKKLWARKYINRNEKNPLERFESRLELAEQRISELEERTIEIINSDEQKEKRLKKSELGLRYVWDTIKWKNINITEVPEGEKTEKEEESYEKIHWRNNDWNLMKAINIQAGWTQRSRHQEIL